MSTIRARPESTACARTRELKHLKNMASSDELGMLYNMVSWCRYAVAGKRNDGSPCILELLPELQKSSFVKSVSMHCEHAYEAWCHSALQPVSSTACCCCRPALPHWAPQTATGPPRCLCSSACNRPAKTRLTIDTMLRITPCNASDELGGTALPARGPAAAAAHIPHGMGAHTACMHAIASTHGVAVRESSAHL